MSGSISGDIIQEEEEGAAKAMGKTAGKVERPRTFFVLEPKRKCAWLHFIIGKVFVSHVHP